ncbi:MAG: 50S ribosomal protein L9 [Mycoplasmataceae bacterium]|nr:50S ribosomal protein L9 [Mycoplasmataceae bacterium]
MKVIIIKKCKDGNVNDVVEVSSGYGTNFLIKNGFAEPINKSSISKLKDREKFNKDTFDKNLELANDLKFKLEELTLSFELKTTNLIVHGSITTKQVNIKLKDLGFVLEKHSVPSVRIDSLGLTKVKVKLFDKVEATLKIMVTKSE